MGNRSSLGTRSKSVRAIYLAFEADNIESKVFQVVGCDHISES